MESWTNMQQAQQQQQETADCGMMPPPNTTLAMSLRRSSSGAILNGVDQLSPSSSCSLKVELHDESSQVRLTFYSLLRTFELKELVLSFRAP